MHGFCASTWAVVSMFAIGGLLTAVVIRFADANLKNLAMALAIILSCIASIPLFGFVPNGSFGLGASLVIASIFLYAWQPTLASGSASSAAASVLSSWMPSVVRACMSRRAAVGPVYSFVGGMVLGLTLTMYARRAL